jgi:hypothetical protein
MTVSMVDQSQQEVLQYTLPSFHDAWVDHQYGGVGLDPKRTKAFHWGNGYHQFEHALIGYLFAQSHDEKAARLFYARPTNSQLDYTPYYYKGDVTKVTQLRYDSVQKVTFNHIRP